MSSQSVSRSAARGIANLRASSRPDDAPPCTAFAGPTPTIATVVPERCIKVRLALSAPPSALSLLPFRFYSRRIITSATLRTTPYVDETPSTLSERSSSSPSRTMSVHHSLSPTPLAPLSQLFASTREGLGPIRENPIKCSFPFFSFSPQVDMLLLAGDLFHENKPSRTSLYQTTAALREYTRGSRPVELIVVGKDGIGIARDAPLVHRSPRRPVHD